MASRILEILRDDAESHPAEQRRVKTLFRSLSVLDEWLDKNEGHTEDEVRVRRMKRLREEALEELAIQLKALRV
jgi:hypothetical protein